MGRLGNRNQYEMTVTPGGVRVSRREVPPERTPEQAAAELAERARRHERGFERRKRGEVVEFSTKSRREMRWALNALPWHELGPRLAMVTLTYPRAFPMDGLEVRRHRKLWFQRWARKWGAPARGMWALEFQRRGAPHIHTYVGLPDAAVLVEDDDPRYPRVVWPWALETWASIVNSGEKMHARRGVDVRMTSYGSGVENARRVGEYFWRESGKLIQKDVPAGYTHTGRFWNYFGMEKREVSAPISRAEFVAMRRPMRTMRDKLNGTPAERGVGIGSTMDGLRIYPSDGVGVGVRLKRWAESVVPDVDQPRPAT